MTDFEDIIASVKTEEIIKVYDGISIDTVGKARPDLDNHLMTPGEQKKNLAFYARAAIEHVGWDGFSEEHKQAFKDKIVQLYSEISGICKQAQPWPPLFPAFPVSGPHPSHRAEHRLSHGLPHLLSGHIAWVCRRGRRQ